MAKLHIVEDTSFVASLMNEKDLTHFYAVEIFGHILKNKHKIRIVMPTTVIFETLFALIRNRLEISIIEKKLWRLLMIFDVLNFTILETTAIRLGRKLQPYIKNLSQNAIIPANDLIVIATSIELDNSPVLTFDKKMKSRFNDIHRNIFCCLDGDDKSKFFNLLNS